VITAGLAILGGVVLGGFAAWIWCLLSRRWDLQALFTAMGRSIRALVGDEFDFLQEYAKLLLAVGSVVFWTLLALVAGLLPLVLVWPLFPRHEIWLLAAYISGSTLAFIQLKRRQARVVTDGDEGGLQLNHAQFFLVQIASHFPWLMQQGAALETRLMRRRLDTIKIEKPLFIAGLARSGTTMLLELLAQAEGIGTHRYRDFPFLATPVVWSRFNLLFGRRSEAKERAHRDGIRITPDSPEAFEEPIWMRFFPKAHRMGEDHVLRSEDRQEAFDRFFREHLQKILWIRKGERYLSKGNYNVTRIEYLASLFQDARFVVMIRHPLPHVESLVRQHARFCRYAEPDQRIAEYLRAAGHFEFGPQRLPISIEGSGPQSLAAWEAGGEHRGYAIQWAAVYRYIADMVRQDTALAKRVLVVRYESLCTDPTRELSRILEHADLTAAGEPLLTRLDHIKLPDTISAMPAEQQQTIWEATGEVASLYGYKISSLIPE